MAWRCFTMKVATTSRVQCYSAMNLGVSFLLLRSMSTGKKRSVDVLWQNFFSDTSQWWDHRPEKINPKFPDFKHKQTQEALWLGDARNPVWVQAKLAAIKPGALQSNVFAWAQRLKKLVKTGQYIKTMEVFHQMQQERICPDSWTFLAVLKACACLRALEDGRRVHKQIIQVGCESDVYVATCLVDMYAKCGSIDDAWSVFNKMPKHDVVTWSAMIGGYARSGQGLRAIELFQSMQQEGVEPDIITFIGVLNACANVAALEQGMHVHAQILKKGCLSNVFIANCLIDMYVKCGSLEDAWSVFNEMRQHNVVTWNSMIGGYVKLGHPLKAMELFQNMHQEGVQPDAVTWNAIIGVHVKSGKGLKALEVFQTMQQEGVEPNAATFTGVLNACANVAALEEGRRVHSQIICFGYESDIYVATCLVDMYAKCGSIEDACCVFNKMQERNVVSWNAIIGGHVKCGHELKAIELFQKMQQEGVEPDTITFVAVLKACTSLRAFEEGRRVHGQILSKGCESNLYVATCLVDMYRAFESIEDAWNVFNKVQEPDVVAWNAMVGGYLKSGQGLKAIELFHKMHQEGVEPNATSFLGALNACASVGDLEEGRCVHSQIIHAGCESDVYVATCLVDMYAKCGSIEDAHSVFIKMQEHNVVTWNAMIGGYVKSGQGIKAIELFQKMHQEGVEPDAITFVGVLNACASVAALEDGRCVHTQIMHVGCGSDIYVANCLVDMYSKCGSIEDAWAVFNEMQEHDVVTWNTMIAGYVKSGQGLKAMELFHKMQQEQVEPDKVTFIGVLNACATVAALEEGRRVHRQSIRVGYESDVHVANCLIDMYSKCGSIGDAWTVFNKIRQFNVVTWNTMIGGYLMSGQALKAMELYQRMQQDGPEPDAVTFVGVLNACASISALEEGRRVHTQVIRIGCESDVYVANCLVNMYAKCGSIQDAWSVFNNMREPNVVTWNAIIGGYVKTRQGLKALELFGKMQQERVEPDSITFVEVLNACASVAALEEGRHVHTQIIQLGCESDVYVANCLVDMYAKCGRPDDAWNVFNKIQEHNVVTWNAMIGGYLKSGQGLKAIKLFRKMVLDGVEPDAITFSAVLRACTSIADLEEGRGVHKQIIQVGCESDVYVANCLVDMYAKCGSIEDAWSVFKNMLEHDVVTWNALIAGYAKSGQEFKAMELFHKMQLEGVEPDAVTFVGMLNACASVAALEEGRSVHSQIRCLGCEVDVYVANCLVDMYAKCGSIEDAWSVFQNMVEHDVVAWNAIIGGYALHGQAEKAIVLFKQMAKEGAEINEITFTCLLSACSHGGLVKEGLRYFRSMISCLNILPTTEHCACMVDLLGRAGHLKEAEELMKRMPLKTDIRAWMSLLGACRVHGNMEIAERAARGCWEWEPGNASVYVLLSNIYAASGKWDSSAAIGERRLKCEV